jgi:hypothetical protein
MTENADYQGVLEALKGRRARLDLLIAGLEAELTGQVEGGVVEPAARTPLSAGPMPAIHADTFFGLSIVEAAKKYLKMARRAQHTTAIADALAKGGLKRPEDGTLSSILVRAAKGREIIKVGKAMWGLSEWYPKPPKDSGEAKAGSKARTKQGRKRVSAKKPQADAPTPKKATTKASAASSVTAPMNGAAASVSGLILEVLEAAAGKPLHVAVITDQVNARGKAATRSTIEGLLAQWAKKDKVKRTAPGTYAIGS